MLKIKDNVDLKELEKYGYERKRYFYERYDYEKQGVIIYEHNRNVSVLCDFDLDTLDTLYDLIKADLVEKVGE